MLSKLTRAGIEPSVSVCNHPTRSTQPRIPPGSLNRVPASAGWAKDGNVTSAGWQVTLCDPIWHVSSGSGEACCKLLYSVYLYTYLMCLCVRDGQTASPAKTDKPIELALETDSFGPRN